MEERHPELFYQYVGQYIGEASTQKGMKLSERLLHIHDIAVQQNYYEEQKKRDQEEMMEEVEEEEDEEEEEGENNDMMDEIQKIKENESIEGSTTATVGDELDPLTEQDEITEDNKVYLENEFLRLMKEKFLSGEDYEFIDYKEVDENEELDDYKQIESDAHDRYFDEDEEEPPLDKNLDNMHINS